jgi:putative copper export protein
VAGKYNVLWKVAGADGHPVEGRFSFEIAAGAAGLGPATDTVVPNASPPKGEPAGALSAPGQAPVPAAHHDTMSFPNGSGFDAESPAYVAIRWLQFAALLILLGTIAFNYAVLGFLRRKQSPDSLMLKPAAERAAALGFWAAAAMAIATVLRLSAQSYAMHGAERAASPTLLGTMLSQTLWGWGWCLQAIGVGFAIFGFRTARRGVGSRWIIAALAVVALAFTPALSGHAASTPELTSLAVLADAAHVIGAGGWLGSLLVVVLAGIPASMQLGKQERGPAIAALFNSFSPTALLFAGLAAATGVFAAWLHLGSVSALWQTVYGRTLLLKLGVISLLAATGAYNWLRVKPTLGSEEAGQRIRRSATVEIAVGAVVLLITAALVATPTPMDMRSMSGDESATIPAAERENAVR